MRSREVLFGLLLGLPIAASAQIDTSHIPSVKEVYRQNSWSVGTNPVGLSFNRFRSFSVAEAGYSHRHGNFGNTSIPASSDVYSLYSESFQTVNKVSLYGKISYTQSQNRQQNWHGMTGDYWQAVNLCDSISGKQHSEQYQLAAGFSLPVNSRWLLGVQTGYQVQLTAKDIDLRNKNQWMEWQITPGVGYLFGNLRLGASLLYIRRKETVDYRNMSSHTTNPVFAAYPLGFFKTLSWDENINWYYTGQEVGGALQLDFNRGLFQLFQEISGSVIGQTVESNRIQNRKEGETDNWQVTYKGKLQKVSPTFRHEWEWLATFSHASNYDPLQHQTESNTWQSDGKLLRSTYRSSRYALTYGYYQLRDAWHPRFSILSGVSYRQAESSLQFYPVEYTQPTHRFTIHTTFVKNFLLPNALLDLSLGGRYGKGGGSIMNEKQLQPGESAPEIPLWQSNSRLQQVFDYETMSRWGLQTSVIYTRSAPFEWFIKIAFDFEKAPDRTINTHSRKIEAHIGLQF